MWTYCIAFTEDLECFMMVRSRKRGGWEMPGGTLKHGELPIDGARREFREETGLELRTKSDLSRPLDDGLVFFGIFNQCEPDARNGSEIMEVRKFRDLPDDLAYPSVEYEALISEGKRMLRGRTIT